MNNCQIHLQEQIEFICMKKDCQQKTLACQKCIEQHHYNHAFMCEYISQISNRLREKLFDGFKQNIEIIVAARFTEIEQKLTEFNREFSQNIMNNYNQKLIDLFNTIDEYNQSTIKMIDSGTSQIMLLIEMITLSQKIGNNNQVIQQQQQYQAAINPQQSDIEYFRQLEIQYFEKQEKYTDNTCFDKEFFAYEQSERIQNILDQPINFYCNRNGENVFASDGLTMKLDDILPRSIGKDISFQLGILLGSFCPEKLKNLFLTDEVNFSGIYGVKRNYYKNSKPIPLILDDYVPLFANQIVVGKNNSIWITILEKAFAKINGSYSFYDINLNVLIQAFFPCPSISIWTNEENLFRTIEEELQQKSFILLQPKSLQDSIYPTYVQLVGFKQVKNPFFDDQVLLFQLKNPAGRNQYQGDWGFQSPYWTEEIQQQIQINNEDDGIFYMDFMNFLNEVNLIQSIRIYDEKIVQEQFILKQKQSSYFQMESQSQFNLVLQIDQKNRGKIQFSIIITQLIEQQQHSKNSLSSQNEGVVIKKVYQMESFQSLTMNLEMGKYVILVKVLMAENQIENKEATLYLFGKKQFKCLQIQKIQNFKQKIMQTLLEEHGKCSYMNDQVIIKSITHKQLGWLAFSILNRTSNSVKLQATIPSNSKGKFEKVFQEKKAEYFLKGKEEFILIVKDDINAKLQFQVDNKLL